MSCKIKYNNDNTIKVVLDQYGDESVLFNQIASLPFMDTKEEALDIYKEAMDLSVSDNLSFKVGEEFYPSYKNALEGGLDIEVGIESKEGFKPLVTVPYNVNPNTMDGFVNKYIKEGLLKDTKVEYLGKTYFKAEGINYADERIGENIIKTDLKALHGTSSVKLREGLIEIIKKQPYTVLDKNHEKVLKGISEELIVNTNSKVVAPRPAIKEDDLQLKLLDVLNKFGVETLSISNYLSKYKIKHGVEPSATALADIANRVVAFKEGNLEIADLTEETMHFIVEALDPTIAENLLRNINQSEEYAQFSEQYREVYRKENPNMSKDDLENQVRKEILGKIMKNATLALQKEGVQKNFFERALDFIKSFFDKINTTNYRQELATINNMVEDMFIRDNLSDYIDSENITSSFRLYNLDTQGRSEPELDKLRTFNSALLTSIETAILTAKRGGSNLASSLVKLKSYKSRNQELLRGKAALDFTAMAKNLVNFVNSELDVAETNNTVLTMEARDVLINLQSNVRTLLSAIKSSSQSLSAKQIGIVSEDASSTESDRAKTTYLQKIDEIVKEISDADGRHKAFEKNVTGRIVDRIIERYDLPESYRDFAENQASTMNKEINVFFSLFGQMNNSSDVLLNLTSSLVEEMQGKATELKQKTFREFANKMDVLGMTAKDLQTLYDEGYILNKYDFNKFENEIEEAQVKAYSKAKGKVYTIEEYRTEKGDALLPNLLPEEFTTFETELNSLLDDKIERPNLSSYYEELKQKHEKLGVSRDTQKFLSALSYQRGSIQRKVMDENNRPIYTEKEKAKLDSLSHERKLAKSMFSSLGTLKEGIIEHRTEPDGVLNKDYFEKGGIYYSLKENSDIDATIAFDIHKLDADYQAQGQKDTNFTAFLETGERVLDDEGISKAIDFYRNNLGIVFTESFWNQSQGPSSLDRYEDSALIFEIRQIQNRLSDLKKKYQDHQNPAEVNGHETAQTDREQIKQLSEDLENRYAELPRLEQTEEDIFVATKDANASYYKFLKGVGIKEGTEREYTEMLKHMTPKNSDNLRDLMSIAKRMDKGDKPTSKVRTERLTVIKEENNLETFQEAAIFSGREKLLPYFKRVTPKNYTTINEVVNKAREEGKSDVETFDEITKTLRKLYADPNFEFNVHYSYKAEEKKAINTNYDPNFKGGIYQPKLSKYRNDKFYNQFGIDKKGNATKDLKKYEALQEVYKLKQSLFDMMDVSNAENVYKAPQISRTNINKMADLLTKGGKATTIKETVKDFLQYRVDDMEYGASDELRKAVGTRIVPKLYVRDLENKSDISDDLFFSLLAMTEQSALHKSRKEGLSDVLALEDKMLGRVVPTGKAAERTRNYEMFKSFVDYNYFGIKESMQYKVNIPGLGQRDITKVFRMLHKYIRVRNLGFNVIVPLTSWITGEANWVIEKRIGEYVSKDAANMAKAEFRRLAPEAMKTDNSLGYNDKSKLNVLGEFLSVYDMTQKAGDAKYGKLTRLAGNSSMVLHQVGNFPVIPKVMLSALMDQRIINGAIVSKNKFYRDNSKMSASEKDTAWRKYSDKTLYSFLDIKPTGVTYKPELLEQLDKGQEYVDSKISGIRNIVKDRLQKIDGQIPESQKLAAQRHALLTFLTTHKGWLSINLQRRFKGAQWNLENNQLEQGSYSTLGGLIADTVSNMRNYNEGLIKSVKKAYKDPSIGQKIFGKELTEEQRDQITDLVSRNTKRLGIELSFMALITLVATMVSMAADDDDLEDIPGMQLTNLLMLRLTNEMASTQLGIGKQVYETTEVPVVGLSNIVAAFTDIGDAFSGEDVRSGKYGGYSKQYRYFFKNIPGLKGIHDLREIQKTTETYKYFNKQNIDLGSLYTYTLWDKITTD